MLKRKINQPLFFNSPEDDLQEISLLEDRNHSFEYKTPVSNGKTEKFRFDGWITSNLENQNLLKTYRSHVMSTSHSHCESRKCIQQKDGSQRTELFRGPQSFKKKVQFAGFRLKKAQSHQFQITPLPTCEIKKEKIQLKTYKKKSSLSLIHFQGSKNQKDQIIFLGKRPILQAFPYPLMKNLKDNSPQRKLTENVGRVRRMLKFKHQRKK